MNRDKKMNDAEKRIRDKESQVSGELSKNKKTILEIMLDVVFYSRFYTLCVFLKATCAASCFPVGPKCK